MNVFDIVNSYTEYQSYGDLMENNRTFNMSREEEEIYEQIKTADKNRLLRFNS